MANIIDKKINPEIPIVQESNRNEVYLPRAGYTNTGTAGFYKTHFIVDDNGIVHLRKAPERAVSAITYDSNTNTLIITFDDETVETIKLNDCGCVDGTDVLVYDAFKVINFKETSWYDISTNKVLIISAAETGYDNDELVCQLDKYNVISTNVNDNVIASNYQSNYEYQIYKCTDGSIAIFANTAFAGRFIILKREFAVQKNVANITYDDATGVLTIYYVTGDKKNVLIDRTVIDVNFPNGDFTDVQYDTTDGITLTGKAKIKYKNESESETVITSDIPLIPADDTINIDRAEAAETKKVLIKATKGLKAVSKTANGGLECTLSDDTKLQTDPFVTIVQAEGTSEEQIMSQKAVTDALAKKLGTPYGVDFPHGAGTVTYDTTDGMHIRGTMRIYTNEDKTAFIDVQNTEVEIPIKAGTGVSIDKAASGEFVEVKNTGIKNIIAGNNITVTNNNGVVNIKFNTDQSIDGLTLASGQYSEVYVDGSYGINFIWNDQRKSVTTLPVAYAGQDATILTNKNVKTLFGNQSIQGSGNIDLYRHVITFTGYGDNTIVEHAHMTLISSKDVKIDSLTKFFSALSDYADVGYPCTGREKLNNETIIAVYPSASGYFDTSSGSSIGFAAFNEVTIIDTVTTV